MRLYLYGGAALGLLLAGFLAGWVIQGWRADSREKAAVEAAATATKAAQQSVIDSLRAEIRTAQESSNAYQAELTRLRSSAIPISPVRVCKPARSAPADLPRTADTAGGSDAASEARGVVPSDSRVDPGPDIAPDLTALARAGDECSAQLRGLIDWVQRTR